MERAAASDLRIGVHTSTGYYNGELWENLNRWSVTAYQPLDPRQPPTTVAILTDTYARVRDEDGWNKDYPPAQFVLDAMLETVDQASAADPVQILIDSYLDTCIKLKAKPFFPVSYAMVIVQDRRLHITSAGDCRIFLLREGAARRISATHTFAEYLIEQGHVTVEELMQNPHRTRMPYRVLSSDYEHQLTPDLRLYLSRSENDQQARANQGLRLQAGDQLLLTSSRAFGDFIEPLDQQRLEDVFIKSGLAPQQAVDQFGAVFRASGDFRDLTVILLKVPDEERRLWLMRWSNRLKRASKRRTSAPLMAAKFGSPSTHYPPVTLAQLEAAEQGIGFRLPELVRDLYLEVGNGGFGPAMGSSAWRAAFRSTTGRWSKAARSSASSSLFARSRRRSPEWDWGKQWIAYGYWGCNVTTVLDCGDPELPIYALDALTLERHSSKTLRQWWQDWLDGTIKQY